VSDLSAITLDWMADRARLAGLDVTDPSHLGPPNFPTHHPDPLGPMSDSMTTFYSLFGNGMRTICEADHSGPTRESLSEEAHIRWNTTDWRPKALVEAKRNNSTCTSALAD
jgi:hypothetical protein